MYQPVLLQPLVADGLHVELLVREVLEGVAPEELDALLTGPLAVLLLLPEGEELVDDAEQPPVLLVDALHTHVVLIPPLKLGVHSDPSFIY